MNKLIAAASVAALLACSSSPKPEPVDPAPAADPAPATDPAPVTDPAPAATAWADMTLDQKKAIMKEKVVPAVAAIWKEGPEPDEEVNCVTCHGKGALEGKFDMPNPGLPSLNPANQFAAHQDDAEWLEFMGTKVVPTVANAIGVDPYDPATQSGFGCFNCHKMAGK